MLTIASRRLPCPVERNHPTCVDNQTVWVTASQKVELPQCETLIRRVLKHPRLMHYNRLIAIIVTSNLTLLGYSLTCGQWWHSHAIALDSITIVSQANFALSIIFRQPHVINFLHWLATRAPTTWPLRLRWALGKVYHFGGVHVGAAVSGTVWYLEAYRKLSLKK